MFGCGGWVLPHGEPLSLWWAGARAFLRGVRGFFLLIRPSPGCRPEVYSIQYWGSLWILLPYVIHTHPMGQQKHNHKWGDGAP